jgi:hypothetical protein
VAELRVVGLQFADAWCGHLDAAQQGGVGGALAVRDEPARGGTWPATQAFDLGAQLGLVVEPGPGHTGLAGEGVDGDG